jgi:DNA/RNA-binding domain of Phe-tRNA-synthetase-like protein
LSFRIDGDLRIRLPDLDALPGRIEGVRVVSTNPGLEDYKMKIVEVVKVKYDLNSLKDGKTFRAYRDFFWRIGVDPTKNRPAAEALIRRILSGKSLPTINNLVDAYNIASIETEIALAAFDADRIYGDLVMRLARRGEEFVGIGMAKPITLTGCEVVLTDDKRLVAIYPHRDAQHSCITLETTNVLLLACGVPSIDEESLKVALNIATNYIAKFCGGTTRVG